MEKGRFGICSHHVCIAGKLQNRSARWPSSGEEHRTIMSRVYGKRTSEKQETNEVPRHLLDGGGFAAVLSVGYDCLATSLSLS